MSEEKTDLHPRNLHRARYDFPELIKSCPDLDHFVRPNKYGSLSIDFADPLAVKTLNRALLMHFYGLEFWDIPEGYLCPPIPGRSDYIHYLADLLADDNAGIVPSGRAVRGFDVGVGANCIYPIIGHQVYGWTFLASDVDQKALKAAQSILRVNPSLTKFISCKLQSNKYLIFKGLIKPDDVYDFSMCNPPFHVSAEAAKMGSDRKLRNLGKAAGADSVLNFGGTNNELWCEGGETAFISRMMKESLEFKGQCLWFSTLVSKSSHLPLLEATLGALKPKSVKLIQMAQGNKVSRVLAWSFLAEAERREWALKRWG